MRPIYRFLVGAIAVSAIIGVGYAMVRGNSSPAVDVGNAGGLANPAGWRVVDKTDKMSGAKSFDAEATIVADTGESFDLVAECTPGFISFTLDDEARDAKLEPGGDNAYFLRTRLDERDVVVARSDMAYTNEASIFFYDPDIAPRSIADGVGGYYGRALAKNSDSSSDVASPVSKLMSGIASSMAPGYLSGSGAGTIKDLEAASRLHIEAPMANGGRPMVTILLRDPALQAFYGRCQRQSDAQYPPAPPVAAASPAGEGSRTC